MTTLPLKGPWVTPSGRIYELLGLEGYIYLYMNWRALCPELKVMRFSSIKPLVNRVTSAETKYGTMYRDYKLSSNISFHTQLVKTKPRFNFRVFVLIVLIYFRQLTSWGKKNNFSTQPKSCLKFLICLMSLCVCVCVCKLMCLFMHIDLHSAEHEYKNRCFSWDSLCFVLCLFLCKQFSL